ncbi:hypothetical protein [Spirosoma foliorum]|uniref:Uncharacterized protein n=1 Tax=Spirosoma foliorum TaxID=2710596 RepID=A0A7G5GS70_9BACT|nr:hypothetical protein [Spirosoma foliorum]QMW01712.1 hypothetical protein H3H32_27745 [Spirosoma foliorum]
MNEKEGEDEGYPPEYAHIEDKVQAAQERARQIDEQIKNVPQNSKPTLAFRPPGFTQPRYFNRERAIASLEQQKSELKEDTFSQVEQEVREADPKAARQVRDQARETLYPNPFRQMDVEKKNTFHSKPKDLELSQNYMDSMFSRSRRLPSKDKSPERGKDMDRD